MCRWLALLSTVCRAPADAQLAAADTVIAEDFALPDPVVPVRPEAVVFTLERGESLADFARWSNLSLGVIADTSGLPLDARILPVGTAVRLPWAPGLEARVRSRREVHHARRVEAWLNDVDGEVSVATHVVAPGDTGTTIAAEAGDLPVWLLEALNPDSDLEHLEPGQKLLLPVFPELEEGC